MPRLWFLPLFLALASCIPATQPPTIFVRLPERGNMTVATSSGTVPATTRTCPDGTIPPAFSTVSGPAVLIPERLGKATFVITYLDPDGLRFVDAQVSLTEAGVVSADGGEERPGEFYAASTPSGQTAEFSLIITPLTDATGFVTLRMLATDQSDQVTQLTLAIALERRVCP